MVLEIDSIKWAINFLCNHSDGDLFPEILELKAIKEKMDDFAENVKGKNLVDPDSDSFKPGGSRRFIVPKGGLAYRVATQLAPQDSIILTALIHQYGQGIENRRLPSDKVFSYRFQPDNQWRLYSNQISWNDFWNKAHSLSEQYNTILRCDIADFYNQIYHHTLENQLIESQFPNQGKKWIIELLESTTAGVSRGVPIGPHAIHLLSECAMIPIDNSLDSKGINFIRFVDDFIVFCDSEDSAKQALFNIASTLDKQQRLILQQHKTKLYNREDFSALCQTMIEDRPINVNESETLEIIKKYSSGNPYATIYYNDISDEDLEKISEETIKSVIQDYINQNDIDYVRLRWFYRRITQIGHCGAVEISLENIKVLTPCFANIFTYLTKVESISEDKWKKIGETLLNLLGSDLTEIKDNGYFRLSILSLFSKNQHINHFSKLSRLYDHSDSFEKREILLSAKMNNKIDWIREHKESYQMMEDWQKMAFMYVCSDLPKDEKKYFFHNVVQDSKLTRPFDIFLAKWAKNS